MKEIVSVLLEPGESREVIVQWIAGAAGYYDIKVDGLHKQYFVSEPDVGYATVTGLVLCSDTGNPAVGALIHAPGMQVNGVSIDYFTDDNGRYTIPFVPVIPVMDVVYIHVKDYPGYSNATGFSGTAPLQVGEIRECAPIYLSPLSAVELLSLEMPPEGQHYNLDTLPEFPRTGYAPYCTFVIKSLVNYVSEGTMGVFLTYTEWKPSGRQFTTGSTVGYRLQPQQTLTRIVHSNLAYEDMSNFRSDVIMHAYLNEALVGQRTIYFSGRGIV